ncbi:hypothetical protein [Glycomyces sp. MUSA5-2]|uniref:hypothetical protein n=1 Tax=Glycomyces sp. MUSA5-2 TaxID=2053002 RepID=UPI00300B7C9E
MGLIAVAELAAAQGATTTALGLAACWPEAEVVPVVVECDPAGGDLAARWDLSVRPGLAEAGGAAAAAEQPGPAALDAGTQAIAVAGRTVEVVCASLGGAEVAPALAVLAAPGSKALAAPDGWVVADAGRLDPHAPTWALLAAADCTVLVARADLEGLAHLRARLDALAGSLAGPIANRAIIALAPGTYTVDKATDLLRAAGVEIPVAGPVGRIRPVSPDPLGWRGKRALGAWHRLAAAVHAKALTGPPLALTAGAADTKELS